MQEQARLAFDALKLRGYARIDFRMTSADDVLLPRGEHAARDDRGTSLIPQAAAAAGILFPEAVRAHRDAGARGGGPQARRAPDGSGESPPAVGILPATHALPPSAPATGSPAVALVRADRRGTERV